MAAGIIAMVERMMSLLWAAGCPSENKRRSHQNGEVSDLPLRDQGETECRVSLACETVQLVCYDHYRDRYHRRGQQESSDTKFPMKREHASLRRSNICTRRRRIQAV